MPEKRPALGKGLSALIPHTLDAPDRPQTNEIDIELLSPNRFQPRGRHNDAGIEELAESIKATGIIQPIVVRRVNGRYHIIAGERRWRAAQRAGLLKVPVFVKEVPDGQEQRLLEMALVENIQREDLNPIDQANAYKRLQDEFHLTQDAIAAAVGKDRSSIANYLRLLKLPAEVRDEVSAGRLSMGHARALLALDQEQAQRNLARDIIARTLSVRETEQQVTRVLSAKPRIEAATPPVKVLDVHTRAAQDKLRFTLGTKVDIVRRAKGGEIRVAFKNEEELIRVFDILVRD
jgi:ParB family transcriptional regulator, chromosome partitioning protein